MTAVLGFCGVSAAVGLVGCAKKAPRAAIPPRPVETAVAVQREVPLLVDTFGAMVSPADVDIKSQVAGQILAVGFTQGQHVAQGALLVTIDAREYQAALDKARAALAKDQADLKKKRDILERNRPLFAKNLVSKQDFEDMETDVASAEAMVEADQATVASAAVQLEYCRITSPVAGLAGKRLVDSGNIVGAGSGPTLVNVKTVQPLYVDCAISEAFLGDMRRAAAAGAVEMTVSPRGQTNVACRGELKVLANGVDPATGTIALRGEVPNEGLELWPGQFVDVRLRVGVLTNAVVVPGDAVGQGKDGPYTFVVDAQGKAELRAVVRGVRDGEDVVVAGGLRPGEQVVTMGLLGLKPGDAVVSRNAAAQQAPGKKEQPAPSSQP